jgi:hypothetical protein
VRELTDEELLDFANILEGYARYVYQSIYNQAKVYYFDPDKDTRYLYHDAVFQAGQLLSEIRTLEFQAKKYRSQENAMPTVPE